MDAYAATIGRWLVTRDGFDFLVFYLPDYDYASHISGPDAAVQALERADAAVGELMAAAGGYEAFLERYAIVVCSDHGQTRVDRVAALQDVFRRSRRLYGTARDGGRRLRRGCHRLEPLGDGLRARWTAAAGAGRAARRRCCRRPRALPRGRPSGCAQGRQRGPLRSGRDAAGRSRETRASSSPTSIRTRSSASGARLRARMPAR